jgi:hypothetical protein
MTTTLEKPSVEKYQDCYLVQFVPDEIQWDLSTVIRGCCNFDEDEVLLSVPLFNNWVLSDFEMDSCSYLMQESCDFLSDLYRQLDGVETGYLIFRPW